MSIPATLRAHAKLVSVALLIYSIAVILPHQEVQDGLFVVAVKPLGLSTFYAVMATLASIVLAVLGFICFRRLAQHPARRILGGYCALTLVLVLLAWRILSVNNSELVHFLQYAITGFVLMSLTLSVTESLSWVLWLGGLDEAYQYAVIHPTWGIPYDFNDVALDFLGGTIGVLLCILWLSPQRSEGRPWRPGPGFLILAATVTAGTLMVLADFAVLYQDPSRTDYWFALSRLPPKGFWFFDQTWGPRTIHSLTPVEGPLLLLLLLFVYSRLDRAFVFRTLP